MKRHRVLTAFTSSRPRHAGIVTAAAALLMLALGAPIASAQTTLTVTKSDSVDPVAPGGTLSYTVRVRNTGAAAATNLVVTETYDGLFTFVSAVPTPNTGNNIWNIPGLAPGAEAVFLINGTVSAGATNGQVLTNSVAARATGDPMETVGDTAPEVTTSETTTVSTGGVAPASLTVTKIDSADPVFPGDPLSYTIRITNTGGTTATGIVLTETYASLFTFGSSTPAASTGNNVWNLDDIAAGGEAVVTVNGTVNPAAVNGNVLANAVQVTSTNAATANGAENTTVDTSLAPSTTLRVSKADTVDPATAGGPLGYTVTVQNFGSSPAVNVVLTETYPGDFVFTSANPPATTGNNVWNLGDIAAGGQTVVNISGTVAATATNGQILTNTVAATADNAATVNGNESTTITAPTGPVLEITKTDSSDPKQIGVDSTGLTILGYTVTVRNTGGSTASNVTLTDTYDARYYFSGATPTPTTGTALGSAVSTWNLGDIAAGASVVVTIDGFLNLGGKPASSDGDVISNMASVVATGVSAVNVTETTNVIDPPFNFTVSKSVSPTGAVAPGATLTYTMVVSVTGGSGSATNVVLTDTYPSDFVFQTTDTAPSSGNNVWNLGTIPTGSSRTVVVTGTVSGSAVGGTLIKNQATATADNAPNANASVNNTVSGGPTPAPFLEIHKSDDNDPRQVGDTLVYTIRVENNGTATANNLVITETYPPFFTFASAAELGVLPIVPTGAESNIFSNFVLIAGSDLTSGGTYFLTITGTVAAGASGSLVNNVSVTSDEGLPAATTETTTIGAAAPLVATLEVTKTDTPDPVQPGATLAYQVIVKNIGTAAATDVVVTETYAAEFTPSSATLNGAPIMAGPGNTFTLGSIAPGGQAVLDIIGSVSNMATNGATLTNSVAVTSSNATGVNTSENTTVSTSTTSLEITKSDSVDPVVPGGTVIYSVRVENTGTETATNVVVTETYPAQFTPSSATLDGAPTMAGPGNTFALGSVAPGAGSAKTLLITGTVGTGVLDGDVLTNSATATADNAGDATTSETTTITAPTLTVTKTDSVDPVAPGAALSYTVTVSNIGTAAATNVVLTETYPADFTFGSATPAPTTGNNVFALGALAAGASSVVTINGTVSGAAVDAAVLSNSVTAAADNAPDAMATETTTVTSPVLTVTKTDSVDPVMPGDPLTYTVTVTNTGSGAATNVVLTETYPTGFTFGSATPAPTTGDNVFALGALAGGASTVVTINGTVDASTPDASVLTNSVTASADNAADAMATETTAVGAAGLTVTKTDNVDPIMPGDVLTYTVTVTNTGTGTANNVVLTETYPSEFAPTSATPPPTTGNNVFALGALAGGASTVVTIVGTVDAATADATVLSNGVTASADNAASATATETTTVDGPITEVTVPTPTGTGNVTATLTGGGATCSLDTVIGNTALAVAGAGPPGVSFPHELLDVRITGCTPGATVTLTLVYPPAPPLTAGTLYWKYGPTLSNPTPHWFSVPATIVGNTVTLQLTDGGVGDQDLTANGTIVDPGGAGVSPAVPVMPWWALALLSLALMWSARVVLRRQGSL